MTRATQASPLLHRRATIKDVALAADVSRSTASRALSGNGYVAEDVRERVREVARSIGYVPDAAAQYLRRRVSNVVGLMVTDLTNPFYAELAAGAMQQARRRGYTVILADGGAEDPDESNAAQAFVEMRAAGVILTPVSAEAGEYLTGHGLVTVEVDRQFAEGVADAVVVDNVDGASRVTARLIELGHVRIALVIDETHWTTGRDRYAGYRAAFEAAGLALDPGLVVASGLDVDHARARSRELLSGPDRPTAVFAANSVLAEGVWRAATDVGLRIPEDLSLVSFDDAPWMSLVSPGVTAVAQDVSAIGATAVDVLLERIAQPAAPAQTVVVPAEVVRRGSTAPPPQR
ncbi:LacI family DNA-binding transcriptional regulator [Georgenia faecalis]|uniref:LacI family DNA-binding transcriptional regulator n=1 Tax=Georgenia faecalis TaxID=2483799 RepID=A0ABV9D643_9MICO|nr:LacI family DNA-binding transcriptional regulator [Georgenia faecalis]